MSFVLSAFMTMYLRKENARRDRKYKRLEEYTVEEKRVERHLGDNASFFRYTVSSTHTSAIDLTCDTNVHRDRFDCCNVTHAAPFVIVVFESYSLSARTK